jgi:hypothetical protein
MSSKRQTLSLHGNKTEPHSDLSRHYREIGIKSVAAATRKKSNAPHQSGAVERKREKRNHTRENTNE